MGKHEEMHPLDRRPTIFYESGLVCLPFQSPYLLSQIVLGRLVLVDEVDAQIVPI